MVGAARFELATPCSRSRCATRLRYAPPVRPAHIALLRGRPMRRLIAAGPVRGKDPRLDWRLEWQSASHSTGTGAQAPRPAGADRAKGDTDPDGRARAPELARYP